MPVVCIVDAFMEHGPLQRHPHNHHLLIHGLTKWLTRTSSGLYGIFSKLCNCAGPIDDPPDPPLIGAHESPRSPMFWQNRDEEISLVLTSFTSCSALGVSPLQCHGHVRELLQPVKLRIQLRSAPLHSAEIPAFQIYHLLTFLAGLRPRPL